MATNEINENNKCGMQDIYAGTTAYNANQEQIKKTFSQLETVFLAKIVSCSSNGVNGSKTVSAIPLIAKVDANGNAQPSPTYVELPHYRIQAGVAGVICDPVVGDIGVFVVCKRDISKINSSTQTTQVPNSFRAFSLADSVMIATIHTKAPTTYIHIQQDGTIEIEAPTSLTINTPKAIVNGDETTVNSTTTIINASSQTSVISPETTISGHLTVLGGITVSGGGGSQITGDFTLNGSMTATNDVVANGISLNSHVHGGVQAGGSDTSTPK